MMSGRYVALEGIEGTGKSSVARFLSGRLRQNGAPVTEVREPGGTPAGEAIRSILLSHEFRLDPWTEALLLAAARAQLAAEVVRPARARGEWVISDRSVYSSLAYQGGARSLGVADVRAVNEAGLGGTWPDLVVLLDVSPEVGLARQRVADRIGAEGVEFQARVAAAFHELAAAEPDRVVVVDASQPLDNVKSTVAEILGIGP